MSLDGAGIGLALLSEVSKFVKSIQERSACYRDEPALFGQLDGTLARLRDSTDILIEKLRNNPQAWSQPVLPDFVATLESVKYSLRLVENAVEAYCSKGFFGSSSISCVRELANKGKCFF